MRQVVPRRRRSRLFWSFLLSGGGLVVILALLAAFLPTLLSTDAGKGFVLKKVEARLGLPLEASDLSLSWTGEQRLEGLRIGQAQGFPAGEDLLRVAEATLEPGLWGLLFRPSEPISLEIHEPVAHLRRDKQGRFNFEPLLEEGRKRRRPHERREKGREAPRGAVLVVTGGEVHYQDQVLGASSALNGVDLSMDLDREVMRIRGDAQVAPAGGGEGGGSLTIDGTVRGLFTTSEPQIQARGEVSSLDLRPYRALLEELLQVTPPEKPIEGTFAVETRDGSAVVTAALDAGFARLADASLVLPMTARSSAGTLRASLELDLEAALHSLGRRAGAPEGLEARGDLRTTVTGTVPFSLESFRSEEARPEGAFTLAADLSLENLEVRVPAGGAGEEGGGEPRVAARQREGPVRGRLELEGRLGDDPILERAIEAGGKLNLEGPLEVGALHVEGLQSDFRLAQGNVTVSTARGKVNGGTVTVEEVALGVATRPLPFRGRFKAEGLEADYDMTAMLAYVVPFLALQDRQAEFRGTLEASLEIEGEGMSREELERALEGKGMVRVREGRLAASRFFQEAAQLLGTDLTTLLFSELGSDFSIGQGKIDARKVFLAGKEGSKVRNLGLRGTTGLDGSLDYGVELSVLEEAIGDRKIRRILDAAGKWLKGGLLPLRLRGTLDAPRLSLDPSLRMPGLEDLPLEDLPIPDLPRLPIPGLRRSSGQAR